MPVLSVVFMLAFAASAWAAWRQSPRYSAKAAWQTLGASVVAMAVIAGVVLWGLPIPLLVAVVVLVTVGVSALILRATDGAMANVPSSAPLVNRHRRRFFRIAKGVVLAVLLPGALDLAIPRIRPAGSTIAGLLAVCAVPLLYGLHHKALRNDRGMSALMAHPWIHWQYSEPEWRALDLASAPSEAYLGPEGVLIGSEFTPWALSGTYLLDAEVRPDPPTRLILRFYIFGGRGAAVDKLLPVPQGARRDLELLQDKLHRICPKARIALAV